MPETCRTEVRPVGMDLRQAVEQSGLTPAGRGNGGRMDTERQRAGRQMRLPGCAKRLAVWQRMPAVAVLLMPVLTPAPALGHEGVRFDAEPLAACITAEGGGRACIGQAADACMDATYGGYSNQGMIACLGAELDWWDADLNAAYHDLHARQSLRDAGWSDADTPWMPPRPSGADTLRDMQRAWIAFRDASCAYEALDWWGGTGAQLIEVTCLLQMTAEQALRLRHYADVMMIDD